MTTTKLSRAVATSTAMLALVSSIHHGQLLNARVEAQSGTRSSSLECAPDRPAVPHHAGGKKANPRGGKKTLIPCITNPGWRSNEPAMVITKAGTVLIIPAFEQKGMPTGGIRSTDGGKTWSFFQRTIQDPQLMTSIDQGLTIDRQTGRLFWVAPGPIGRMDQTFRLDFSDDDGKTWTRVLRPLGMADPATGEPTRDHPFLFVGPPPASLRSELKDYPNVVYVCAAGAPQLCGRSLDGGRTFSAPVGLPFPRECGGPFPPLPPEVIYNTNVGLRGVVDRSGTVYVPNTPCKRPYLAISRDGGATWTATRVADTIALGYGMLSIGIDPEDNLYATWSEIESRMLYFSVSRDRGAHWSTPMAIAAPGVNETALPMIVVGDRGHAVVAYYGSTNSPGAPFPPSCVAPDLPNGCVAYARETWNMYVTATYNGLDQQPVFWSTTLNNPAHPVLYGCTPAHDRVFRRRGGAAFDNSGACQGPLDYFGLFMTSDGTTWLAFPQVCPGGKPVDGNPNCPGSLTGGNTDRAWALVGRLTGK